MQALAYYIDLKENCRNISQAREMVSVGSAPIAIHYHQNFLAI